MDSVLLWYASRATGVVATVLLTAALVLGLVTSSRHHPHGPSQTVVTALHRSLSLGMCAFLAAHVLTAAVDTYVPIGWVDVVVPFVSGYERTAMGVGTLALDVVGAVVVTSLVRHRIREKAWRAVHLTAYLLWPLAVAHSLLLATADQPLLRGASLASAAVGLGALAWRALTTTPDDERRAAIASQEWT